MALSLSPSDPSPVGHEGEPCQGKCNINMGKTGFSPGRFEKSQFGTIRKSGQIQDPWVPWSMGTRRAFQWMEKATNNLVAKVPSGGGGGGG